MLERVRGARVGEVGEGVLVAELGVLVQRDLAVEGDDLAVLGEYERVDLDERRVLAPVDVPELDERGGDVRGDLRVEAGGGDAAPAEEAPAEAEPA